MKRKFVALSFIVALLFVSVGLAFSQSVESSPVVSIVFDDGRVSQFKYAFPLMQERGLHGTYYLVTDLVRDVSGNYKFMSFAEAKIIQDAGNEIGSHSVSHPSFTGLSESQIRYQCVESKNVLEAHGLEVNNFAYPYGSNSAWTDSIVDDYYVSARDAYNSPYVMDVDAEQFCLTAVAGETGNSYALSNLKSIVDGLDSGDWAIIFFHSVEPYVDNKSYVISTQSFEAFLDYVIDSNVVVKSVNEVLSGNYVPSVPDVPQVPDNSDVMTVDDWENFFGWLKARQTEDSWGNYLDSMLEEWKSLQ